MEIYRKSAAETFTQLEATEKGLTTSEETKRQEKYGFNELKYKKKDPFWKLFLETFKDPMVLVLVIAALVQLVLGEVVVSLIIF
ncbi:cation-transporting P-type ATPase, partial [Listeria monocytogenes]|uniref:cation-transporting P-type ATPase n=1 Tax=Listeria monocytogenes TaxID=1639 RepID=UPI0034A1AF09